MRPVGLEVAPTSVLPRENYPPLPDSAPQHGRLPRPLALVAHIARTDPRFAGTGLDVLAAPVLPGEGPAQSVAKLALNKPLVRYVTDEMVSVARRAPQQFDVYRDGARIVCSEEAGHMEKRGDRFALVRGQTLSSDASKREQKAHPYLRHYNANMTVMKIDGVPVTVRSGRSDTQQKIEETLLFGAAHAAGDIYRAAIITGMDYSVWKKWFNRMVGGEDESIYLSRQNHAITDLFAAQDTRAYTLSDGRQVSIARPLHFNLVFSGQARNPVNILMARYRNKSAALRLFDLYAQQCGHRALARALRSAVTDSQKAWCLNYEAPALLRNADVSNADRLSVDALKLIITGRDIDGARHLYPASAAIELMMLGTLLQQCGITAHVQCKSGQDRALAMASTLTGAALFARLRGALCTPAQLWRNAGDMSLLRHLFTQVADTFGAQHIKLVRGINGRVKWRGAYGSGKPVPQLLYQPYNSTLGLKPALDAWRNIPSTAVRACGAVVNWTSAILNSGWANRWGSRRAIGAGYEPIN